MALGIAPPKTGAHLESPPRLDTNSYRDADNVTFIFRKESA